MKAVRIIFFVLIVFLSLPGLTLGITSLLHGVRARGDVWSVEHSYFGEAAGALIPTAIALLFAALGAFRPGRLNWIRFALATAIVLFMAATIPSWYYPPEQRARSAIASRMHQVKSAVELWGAERGKYPLSGQELAEAIKSAGIEVRTARFQRGRQPVEFEITTSAGASGPVTRAERPGVVQYAVSAEGTRYWITATTLPKAVSAQATLVTESRGGPPQVMEGRLEPPVDKK